MLTSLIRVGETVDLENVQKSFTVSDKLKKCGNN